jgi:hypothetical protein
MKISNPIDPALLVALKAVKAELEPVIKDAENPHFKHNYAPLDTVLHVVEPVLEKHGFILLQPIGTEIVDGKICTRISTMLLHEKGVISIDPFVENPSGGDQRAVQIIGSNITYMRRYGLLALLGIAPEDDDGNGGKVYEKKPDKPAKPKRPYTPNQMLEALGNSESKIKDGATQEELDTTLTVLYEACIAMAGKDESKAQLLYSKACLWFFGTDDVRRMNRKAVKAVFNWVSVKDQDPDVKKEMTAILKSLPQA